MAKTFQQFHSQSVVLPRFRQSSGYKGNFPVKEKNYLKSKRCGHLYDIGKCSSNDNL